MSLKKQINPGLRVVTAGTAAIIALGGIGVTGAAADATGSTASAPTASPTAPDPFNKVPGATETGADSGGKSDGGEKASQPSWHVTLDGRDIALTSDNGKYDATATLSGSTTTNRAFVDNALKATDGTNTIALKAESATDIIVYTAEADKARNLPAVRLTVTIKDDGTTTPDPEPEPAPETTWSVKTSGTTIQFTKQDDGSYTAEASTQSKLPQDTFTATPSSGDPEPLTVDQTASTVKATDSGTLGVITIAGSRVYTATATDGTRLKLTIPYKYKTGTAVTLKDGGTKFTKDDDTYKAAASVKLDDKNKPAPDSIGLKGGADDTIKLDGLLGDATIVPDKDGKQFVTRTGTTGVRTITVTDKATGVSVSQKYTVAVTASRAEDKTFRKLTVTETTPEGKTVTHGLPGFKESDTGYTIELPHSSVNSSFTLAPEYGVDAKTDGKVGVKVGANASRILTITVNNVQYSVTVGFAASDIQPDSPAKLSGIYVNMTGQASKGQLIDNWNPNRLDYVITIGEKAPAPYVLPEAADGVTITPGDLTQNADSMKQEWKVSRDGQTRVYSVTVVRQHAWKTAADSFKPSDPVEQTPTQKPESDADTGLASHGYVDASGKYVKVTDDDYRIPQGGRFSYEAKVGQSVSSSVDRVKAMTYRYTVTVLPADPFKTPAQHTYTVTYITDATHRADLTGISVDGEKLHGFNPEKHSYTTMVNDPNQWVISPSYDKTTGMSVKTSKKGADATITVTSADGLNTVEYKVHVTRKPFGGKGHTAMNLAQTGETVGPFIAVGGGLALILTALGLWGRRLRRRTGQDDDDATASDTAAHAS